MIAPEELKERTKEIKLYLAEDNVAQAVKRLMDFFTDFSYLEVEEGTNNPFSGIAFSDYENQAILISQRYNRVEKELRFGIVAREKAHIDQNRLTLDLLNTLRALTGELFSKLKPAA